LTKGSEVVICPFVLEPAHLWPFSDCNDLRPQTRFFISFFILDINFISVSIFPLFIGAILHQPPMLGPNRTLSEGLTSAKIATLCLFSVVESVMEGPGCGLAALLKGILLALQPSSDRSALIVRVMRDIVAMIRKHRSV
jgi:hypothetical protein